MTEGSTQPANNGANRDALLARMTAIVARSATDPSLAAPAQELHQLAVAVRTIRSLAAREKAEGRLPPTKSRAYDETVAGLRAEGKAIADRYS